MNRSKAPLALMGQLLMVLFFALAAAICLQAFAKSEVISQDSAARDAASLLAQNTAETLKHVHGDLEEISTSLGGTIADGTWSCYGDGSGQFTEDGDYRVAVERLEGEDGLGNAEIKVFDREGKEIVSLNCSWQEELQ